MSVTKARKLRLVLWPNCPRSCEGCCNKQFDLAGLEECYSYAGYDEILLTGGEPLMFPNAVCVVIDQIRRVHSGPIYVYTAKTDPVDEVLKVLDKADGLCVSLHAPSDVVKFADLQAAFGSCGLPNGKSLRLNVFHTADISRCDVRGWVVKDQIEWLDPCPLPAGEVMMKSELFDFSAHLSSVKSFL